MNSLEAKKSNSIFGTASLIFVAVNIILFAFMFVMSVVFKSEAFTAIGTLMLPVIAFLGVITGAIALFTKRAWVGLVLNILLVVGSSILFIWINYNCCAPPPSCCAQPSPKIIALAG